MYDFRGFFAWALWKFDVIQFNGDKNLMDEPLEPEKEGIAPRYKMRLIEEEFKQLMFDEKDV